MTMSTKKDAGAAKAPAPALATDKKAEDGSKKKQLAGNGDLASQEAKLAPEKGAKKKGPGPD